MVKCPEEGPSGNNVGVKTLLVVLEHSLHIRKVVSSNLNHIVTVTLEQLIGLLVLPNVIY